MSYKVTNISGGQLVCDLAVEGKTLRLNNKQSETIKDSEITKHLEVLATKGLILLEKIKTRSVHKNTSKEKEE